MTGQPRVGVRRFMFTSTLLLVAGVGVAGCLPKASTGDRQIVVNAFTEKPGPDPECFRLTLDPDSDDMILEARGFTLALTESSVLVRVGELNGAAWAEIPHGELADDWQSIVDQRAFIGEEIFGQTGREIKSATTWELQWLRHVCFLDPAADHVGVTGSAVGLYDGDPERFPGARGFQVERDSGQWRAPSPVVATDDLEADERPELRAAVALFGLLPD